MIRKHWKLLLATSLVTLLPLGLLLEGGLPLPFLPVFLLLLQWLCIYWTAKDPGSARQSRKSLGVALWIIPVLSNFCAAVTYFLSTGAGFSSVTALCVFTGLLFAVLGNYLPKTRPNRTLGIKVFWTYSSEENWSATHRFAGKLWVAGGLGILLAAFLPMNWSIGVLLAVTLVVALAPVLYSYLYYRRQKRRGDALTAPPRHSPRARAAVLCFTAALLIFLIAVLFTGEIRVGWGDDAFTVQTSFYGSRSVRYDAVTDIEYRAENMSGVRVWGYGSFRLLMGRFHNEEFGDYNRYTYYDPGACIVLRLEDETLVLSGVDAAATEALYRELLSRTGG